MARWAPAVMALILVAGIAAAPGTQESLRIGLVNVAFIMEQTPGYEQARNTFMQERQGFEGELQRLQAEFDSIVRAFDQQQVVLSPTAREEKIQEMRQLEQRLQQRAQELQIRVQQRERELVEPLEQRVQAVIEGLRAERNIAVVFDVSQQGSSIIAADQSLDLTGTVVERLRAAQPQQ